MTAQDPWDLLARADTVLAVHAHPDDESLATGALLAELTAAGTRVVLLTATRGEEGEVVPGSLAPGEQRSLEEVRAEEVDRAAAALGIAERHLLGTAPALAPGAEPRRHRDSGMRWVREGLAGPSETAGPESFTHRPEEEAVADLVALLEAVRPDVVLGYDDAGTYGHPDHVRAHQVTRAACRRTGTPVIEVASAESTDSSAAADARDVAWREHPGQAEAVRTALAAYRTQLTVLGQEADGTVRLRHVGGQDDAVRLRTGLHPVR